MDANRNATSDASALDHFERWMHRRHRAEKVAEYFAADLFRSGMGCLGLWLGLVIFTDDPASNTVNLMILLMGLLQVAAHTLALAFSIIEPADRYALDRN